LVNTSGNNNVAIGQGCLVANLSGGQNVAIGPSALATCTAASNNTAVGSNALQLLSSGTQSVAVGYAALATVGTASNNTAVGYNALTSATGADNTALGNSALSAGSNSGGTNTAIGSLAGGAITSGSGNTLVGYKAGNLNGSAHITTENTNTCIGDGASIVNGVSSGIAIGSLAQAAVSNGLYFPASLATVSTGSTGSVVYDSVTGQMGVLSSSIQFKENIASLEIDSSALYSLRPVSFDWKSSGERDFGYIAEEVLAILPKLVPRNAEGRPSGVHYDKLPILLVEEVKRLRGANLALEARVRLLEKNEEKI
jgi:hypothetical protein